jgi:DNA-binding Lrp family transcriptional regulator
MTTVTTPLEAAAANALARRAQAGVPFVPDPFAALGAELELPAEAVVAQLRAWSEEGKLREISAVLEGDALGYESALCAGSVPEGLHVRTAAVLAAHPTVTHHYLRDHALDTWFTLAVPEAMGLERTLAILAREAGVPRFVALRRTHVFKIGVQFDLETLRNVTTAPEQPPRAPARLRPGDRDVRRLRALQEPLPLRARPFAELAGLAGVTEDELLGFARAHLGEVIRRYVATFRHRKLGVRANAMVAWRADEAAAARIGPILAAAPEVSHCYAREAVPGFPYTVYSMVHGPDEPTCRAIVSRLSAATGVADRAVLFSTRELKKERLRYFLPELDRWWAEHAGEGEVRHDA